MSKPNKSKQFQFGMRSLFLFCIASAIAVFVYKWYQSPNQTIRKFDHLIETQQFADANAMLEFEDGIVVSPDDNINRLIVVRRILMNSCQRQRRSLADVVGRRQCYGIVGNRACYVGVDEIKAHWLVDSVVVDRGKIRVRWSGPVDQNIKFSDGEWKRDQFHFHLRIAG